LDRKDFLEEIYWTCRQLSLHPAPEPQARAGFSNPEQAKDADDD
jgi:hypothetical protein